MLLKMNDYIQSVTEILGKRGTHLKNKNQERAHFSDSFGSPLPLFNFPYLIHTCCNVNLINLTKNQVCFLINIIFLF